MATKDKAVYIAETASYQIQRTDSRGVTRTTDDVPMIEHLEVTKAVQIFAGFAKEQKNLRDAACSLLADILTFAAPSMKGYKGMIDPKGDLTQQIKDTFRDAESAFFKQFMDSEHEMHAEFLKRLPKQDERGREFLVLGKPNPEAQFQYFLTVLRKAPSYANAKNVVLSFWGFCGQSPMASDGSIIAPEVMRVMVAEVRQTVARDNGIKARLTEILREWKVEEKNPPSDDLPTIVHLLTELLDHARTKATVAAELATQQAHRAQNVKDASDKAIESARKTLEGVGKKEPEVKPVEA